MTGRVLVALCALALVTAACGEADFRPPAPEGPALATSEELLAQLDELERDLPERLLPASLAFEPPITSRTVGPDAIDLERRLANLEPELRRLFASADDAPGDVADAVAEITRGWLEVWAASGMFAAAEAHDAIFPIDARNADDVAVGADDLRMRITTGLELVLRANERHLTAYAALRDHGGAEPAAQARLDRRAGDAAEFDVQVRPRILKLLAQPSTSVIASTERFETVAPGIEPRSQSLAIVCVDRDAADDAGTLADPDVLRALAGDTPVRIDCPDLPTDEN